MHIVIDISEEEYNIAKYGQYGNINIDIVRKAIANGTPLPKGHGRLIDISEYEDKYFNTAISFDDGNHIHKIYDAPTIIEADTESGGEE